MKNDKYLRIVLTIIAVCLLWICARDLVQGTPQLYSADKVGPVSAPIQQSPTYGDLLKAVNPQGYAEFTQGENKELIQVMLRIPLVKVQN